MEKSESSQNYYLGIGAGDREGHWEGIWEGDWAGLGLDQDHQDQRDETESHLKIVQTFNHSKSQKLPNIFCIQNSHRFPSKCSKQVHFLWNLCMLQQWSTSVGAAQNIVNILNILNIVNFSLWNVPTVFLWKSLHFATTINLCGGCSDHNAVNTPEHLSLGFAFVGFVLILLQFTLELNWLRKNLTQIGLKAIVSQTFFLTWHQFWLL